MNGLSPREMSLRLEYEAFRPGKYCDNVAPRTVNQFYQTADDITDVGLKADFLKTIAGARDMQAAMGRLKKPK